MKLEALTLEVRPRTPWEAMDLAVRLVMTHWRLLAGSWMVTVFPLFIIINLVLLNDHPIWAFTLVWFFKPLYDRIPLFVLSRLIFAQKTTYRDVLNAVPALLKTGVIASLTLYRLDPGRSFSLPVRQLEGLKGARRRERMNTLHRDNNREVLFFVLCFHLETLISWGLISLLLMLLPVNMALQGAEELFLNEEPGLLVNALSVGFYFFTMMLVESLYVAGGFVLYLNRRIILEGWDIELVFRKLSQRQTQLKPQLHTLQSVFIALTAVSLFFFSSIFTIDSYAAAQNPSTSYQQILPPLAEPPLVADDSDWVIEEVMAEPVFERFKEIETLEYTGDIDRPEEDEWQDYLWLKDSLTFIGQTLAFIFEIGLWILLFVAAFLLVKYRHRLYIGFLSEKKISNISVPNTLFGLDVRAESLPDNVAQQALSLYREGEHRAAMALLYRAALADLVQRYHFDLKQGATEGDCMLLVTQELALPSEAEGHYFVDLTRAWQLTAYAHRMVSEAEMQQLCDRWSVYYDHDKAENRAGQENE